MARTGFLYDNAAKKQAASIKYLPEQDSYFIQIKYIYIKKIVMFWLLIDIEHIIVTGPLFLHFKQHVKKTIKVPQDPEPYKNITRT